MEALRLRVQDLDFNRQELTVRNGKGGRTDAQCFRNGYRRSCENHLEEVQNCTQTGFDGWMGYRCNFPMPWLENIGMLQRSGAGNGCFPSIGAGRIQLRTTGTPSSRSEFDSEIGAERCAGSWYQQAGQLPQLAPFLCYPPAREGTGHSHNSGIDGPQGPKNNNDLYARSQSRANGCRQPGRFPVKKSEKSCRRYRVRIKSPHPHRPIPQTHCTACPLEQVAGFPSAA